MSEDGFGRGCDAPCRGRNAFGRDCKGLSRGRDDCGRATNILHHRGHLRHCHSIYHLAVNLARSE
jgi:hypothetical protein